MRQLPTEQLDRLAKAVNDMALLAVRLQDELTVTSKADGSPVTQADLTISGTLISLIARLFPEAAIVSEEHDLPLKKDAPWTFVLDPIDGTGVYSDGLPSWCVSLGILDEDRQPVGALIDSPRFGVFAPSLFIRLDPGGNALLNRKVLVLPPGKEGRGQVMAGSDAIRRMKVEDAGCKMRCFGSTVLHMLSPALIGRIHASVQTVGYAWDFAAPHAVLRSLGMDIVDQEGKRLVYDDALLSKEKVKGPLYAGLTSATDWLRSSLSWR